VGLHLCLPLCSKTRINFVVNGKKKIHNTKKNTHKEYFFFNSLTFNNLTYSGGRLPSRLPISSKYLEDISSYKKNAYINVCALLFVEINLSCRPIYSDTSGKKMQGSAGVEGESWTVTMTAFFTTQCRAHASRPASAVLIT